MDQVHQEVGRVMGDRAEPTVADYTDLKYTMRWLRSPPPPSSVPQAPLPQTPPHGSCLESNTCGAPGVIWMLHHGSSILRFPVCLWNLPRVLCLLPRSATEGSVDGPDARAARGALLRQVSERKHAAVPAPAGASAARQRS